MVYTGRLVAWREGLSRVSFDETDFPCTSLECGSRINRLLTVPGAHIEREGGMVQVLRCLDCTFDEPVYVYFDAGGRPTKVVTGFGDHMTHTFQDRSPVASIEWNPGPPDPNYDSSPTFAGGEPDWLQGDRKPPTCPECRREMAFVLQLSSATLDGTRDALGNPIFPSRWPRELSYPFEMAIEFYATLYLFECVACRVNASVTEST